MDAKTDPSSDEIVSMSIVAVTSPDGLHWTAGKALDLPDPDLTVGQMVEGPAGLMAIGDYAEHATCGGPAPVPALWLSADGVSWSSVDMKRAFGSDLVWDIEAGSAGYIATGDTADGKTAITWVSSDGRTWLRHPLTASVFKNGSVESAAAFAGGFVMSGSVVADEGCGGGTVTSTIWWSADGSSWIRVPLKTSSAATDGGLSVARINDHALVAIHGEVDKTGSVTSESIWTSTDGQTWTSIPAPALDGDYLENFDIVTNGQRGLALPLGADDNGRMTILAFRNDLTVATLAETGDVPTDDDDQYAFSQSRAAFGPTGLVVADPDGTRFWIGVPTSN
jgi:hypothetical protein